MDRAREIVYRSLTNEPAVSGQQAARGAHERNARDGETSQVTGVAAVLLSRAVRHAEATIAAGERSVGWDDEEQRIRDWMHRQQVGRERRAAARLDTSRTSFSKKDQSGTFCSISEVSDAIFADDLGAHHFRHRVAAFLYPLWPKRAAAILSCGEAGARCDCGSCGAAHVLPYRCGARSCPTCAHTAAAIVGAKLEQRAATAFELLDVDGRWEGRPINYKRRSAADPSKPKRTRRRRSTDLHKPRAKSWRMVTCTTRTDDEDPYEPNGLRRRVKLTRKGLGDWFRATPWGQRVNDVSAATGRPTKRARRDTMYIAGLEVSPGGTLLPDGSKARGGMVHIHFAIYGEYVADWYLQQLWKQHCEIGGWVSVERINATTAGDFRKALREVLKYVSKGDKEPGVRAERAAVVEYALKNVRRIEMGGALRLVPAVTEKDVATNARSCEACGASDTWRWQGMRRPEYVQANGGFGLSHVVDEADAALRTDVDRRARRARDATARAEWAAEAFEHAPGGQFYGGSPPPWMDDAEEWEITSDGREPVTWAS